MQAARTIAIEPLLAASPRGAAYPQDSGGEEGTVERLDMPGATILPAHPSDGIVLNIPERAIYVFRHGTLLARYPAAVGRPSWRTPIGRFRVAEKVFEPIWQPPDAMVRRERVKRALIPPGPSNPLGDRWMGWSGQQVGFHTTWQPASVGRAASHGCVRLAPEAGHRLFDLVTVGTPIYSVYEPAKIGASGSHIYLSVSPDLYSLGGATLVRVCARLDALGLHNLTDSPILREIVSHKDGLPHFIGDAPNGVRVVAL
jgi:L,D-transpeptidase ErfK/SrfK